MTSEQPCAKQFDERQLLIRGQVFWHGLLVAVGLLVGNAFLQAVNVVWATGFTQNVFIVLATAAVVASEAILRGAFFRRRQNRWVMIAVYGVVGLSMIGLHTSGALKTVGLPRSDHVAYVVAGVLFCCIAAAGLFKELAERHTPDE